MYVCMYVCIDKFLSYMYVLLITFNSLFACLVMASKVWDDLSMWNKVSHYTKISLVRGSCSWRQRSSRTPSFLP